MVAHAGGASRALPLARWATPGWPSSAPASRRCSTWSCAAGPSQVRQALLACAWRACAWGLGPCGSMRVWLCSGSRLPPPVCAAPACRLGLGRRILHLACTPSRLRAAASQRTACQRSCLFCKVRTLLQTPSLSLRRRPLQHGCVRVHVADAGCSSLSRLSGLTCLNLSQNPRLGDPGVRLLAQHLNELQVGPGGRGRGGGGGGERRDGGRGRTLRGRCAPELQTPVPLVRLGTMWQPTTGMGVRAGRRLRLRVPACATGRGARRCVVLHTVRLGPPPRRKPVAAPLGACHPLRRAAHHAIDRLPRP